MTEYSVYCESANYSQTFYSVTPAKREMKRLMKEGHTDVHGTKTKIYANGDWVPCGPIELTGSNKTFIANSGMTKANY